MKKRLKNPYFWIGVGGVVLTAVGISPEMLTDWHIVGDSVLNLLKNPYMLGSVAMALIGVFVSPTTQGLGDGVVETDENDL